MYFVPEKTCAIIAVVEARKTDPAVRGTRKHGCRGCGKCSTTEARTQRTLRGYSVRAVILRVVVCSDTSSVAGGELPLVP